MEYLYILKETYTNGYNTEMLDVISILAILSGILVIVSKNPVVSVLFLIGLFASISCYLLMIGLSFLGLSYLIVYIGAVSILFLFILMLLNIRISELQNNTNNSIPLAIAIGIFFSYPIFQLLPYNTLNLNNSLLESSVTKTGFELMNFTVYNKLVGNYEALANNKDRTLTYTPFSSYASDEKVLNSFSGNYEIYFATSKIWDGNLVENSHITSIGNIMYTNYSIWLIITSYILLLAMVGAIVITIKQKTN